MKNQLYKAGFFNNNAHGFSRNQEYFLALNQLEKEFNGSKEHIIADLEKHPHPFEFINILIRLQRWGIEIKVDFYDHLLIFNHAYDIYSALFTLEFHRIHLTTTLIDILRRSTQPWRLAECLGQLKENSFELTAELCHLVHKADSQEYVHALIFIKQVRAEKVSIWSECLASHPYPKLLAEALLFLNKTPPEIECLQLQILSHEEEPFIAVNALNQLEQANISLSPVIINLIRHTPIEKVVSALLKLKQQHIYLNDHDLNNLLSEYPEEKTNALIYVNKSGIYWLKALPEIQNNTELVQSMLFLDKNQIPPDFKMTFWLFKQPRPLMAAEVIVAVVKESIASEKDIRPDFYYGMSNLYSDPDLLRTLALDFLDNQKQPDVAQKWCTIS